MIRSLVAMLTALLLGSAVLADPPATPKPKPPPPKPWLDMDRGPLVSATIESAYPHRNITQKGLAIRLDEKTSTWVLFDEDLFRYSLAWTGGFIDWKGVLFDGEHRVWPSAVGHPIFGADLAPGWAHDGNFDDPRTHYKSTEYTKESDAWRNRPYGPLPHDHAQFKGLYLHDNQVILSYTVNGTAILDSPGFESAGELPVITRTLNIAGTNADLDLNVFQDLPKGGIAPVNDPSKTPQPSDSARNTLAIFGDHRASSTPNESALVAAINDAPADLTWIVTPEYNLRLHIPAHQRPVTLKLLIARATLATLPTFESFIKTTAAGTDLKTLTNGGPPRYPQQLTTTGVTATATNKPFLTDTLTAPNSNPFKSRMRFGAFDFYEGGKSAAITTWDGDVWRVSNIDEKLDHLAWQRIATGLYQPLGLKILTNPQSAARLSSPKSIGNPQSLYVLCRDALYRLHDLNNDGEIDFYECVNNDAQVTEHFHEFAMGLQTDPDGNFYYAKSARHALDAVVPQHGTILRISKDGAKTDILANGFRAANGIGIGPSGELAVTDQEGFWTPANRINLFTPSAGHTPFFGNLWSYLSTPRTTKDGYDPPLCWIPVNVDRSPAEDLWVTSDKWGPLKGQMLHTSYGTGKLFLVLYETVDGVPQGGIVPLPDIAFRTGAMRARFNPADGQLYLCGLVGWATNMTEPGGFYRVRYTGAPLDLPTALHVHPNAISLTFSDPLDKPTAQDPANYSIQQWNYRWTQNYGSKHYTVTDPKKEGHDDVEITATTVSDDAKTVTLTIPTLQPVMQMKIELNLKSATGHPIKQTLHNTINRIPTQ